MRSTMMVWYMSMLRIFEITYILWNYVVQSLCYYNYVIISYILLTLYINTTITRARDRYQEATHSFWSIHFEHRLSVTYRTISIYMNMFIHLIINPFSPSFHSWAPLGISDISILYIFMIYHKFHTTRICHNVLSIYSYYDCSM